MLKTFDQTCVNFLYPDITSPLTAKVNPWALPQYNPDVAFEAWLSIFCRIAYWKLHIALVAAQDQVENMDRLHNWLRDHLNQSKTLQVGWDLVGL